jgi:perosamine synthetase
MCLTDDDELAGKIRLLKGQGMDPQRRYWFPIVGYNYRMTNIEAALGVAQVEQAESLLARRREVFAWYRELLGSDERFEMQPQLPHLRHACWMFTVLIPADRDRDTVARALRQEEIETRPVFPCMHLLPPYRHLAPEGSLPIAEDISRRGLNLPTSPALTRADVERVCSALRRAVAL